MSLTPLTAHYYFFMLSPSEQTPQHTHSHVSLYPPFPWIMSLKSESTGEAFSLLFLLRQDKLMETYQCTVQVSICAFASKVYVACVFSG